MRAGFVGLRLREIFLLKGDTPDKIHGNGKFVSPKFNSRPS